MKIANRIKYLGAILLSFSAGQLMAEQSNTNVQTFKIDGRTREYYLYTPENIKEGAPLVLVLHGYGGTAMGIRKYSGMDQIADKNGFVVCYPQANSGKGGNRAWNVGYSNYEVDDVKFLTSLIKHLQKENNLSTNNTFCTGMSNGGDMTILLACKRPDMLAAVAPVVGCLMNWVYEAGKSSSPIPIFMTNGTNDRTTLWKGEKEYEAKPIKGYMSTPDMVKFWVKKNEAKKVSEETLPNNDTSDGSEIKVEKWSDSTNKHPVWLYSLVGGGHDWPGAYGNKDVVISDEIWNFFRQFTK
jgi:polyhydroxybutyrate depolymerase